MNKKFTLIILIFITTCVSVINAQQSFCPISGPSEINDDRTYSYAVFDNGASIFSWTVSGSLELVSGNRTPRIGVRKKANATSETGIICVLRFNGFSDVCSECKNVRVASGCIERVNIVQTEGFCPFIPSYAFRASTTLTPGSDARLRYSWSVSNGTIIGSSTGQTIRVAPRNPAFSPGTVRVTVTGCGSSKTASKRVFCEPTCGPNPCLVLSPNPTSTKSFTMSLNELNFNTAEENEFQTNPVTKPSFKVDIINQTGTVVQSFYTSKKENAINMKKFPAGRYFVRVTNGKKKTFTESIIIN